MADKSVQRCALRSFPHEHTLVAAVLGQCAPVHPPAAGVVGGSCSGWPKPSWQTVLGNPHDGCAILRMCLIRCGRPVEPLLSVLWSDTHNGGLGCGSDPAPGTAQVAPLSLHRSWPASRRSSIKRLWTPGQPRSHVLSARRCRVWFERAIALATRIMVGRSPATAFSTT